MLCDAMLCDAICDATCDAMLHNRPWVEAPARRLLTRDDAVPCPVVLGCEPGALEFVVDRGALATHARDRRASLFGVATALQTTLLRFAKRLACGEIKKASFIDS